MAQAGLKLGWAVGLAALGATALWGCAEGVAPTPAATASAPIKVVPGSLLLPPPGEPRPPLRDTCGAAALSGLIGRPRSEIPVPVDLTRRRVACTACPVAPDVRLDRLNILYDAQTGRITKITCG